MVTSAPTSSTRGALRRASAPRLCALRGATTVEADTPTAVAEAVHEMLAELVRTNSIAPDQVLSAIFSATPDVRSLYPAAVAREMGWDEVPMLCVAEMPVDGALPRCVRVLLHISTTEGSRLQPCYLRGARILRPDLNGGS